METDPNRTGETKQPASQEEQKRWILIAGGVVLVLYALFGTSLTAPFTGLQGDRGVNNLLSFLASLNSRAGNRVMLVSFITLATGFVLVKKAQEVSIRGSREEYLRELRFARTVQYTGIALLLLALLILIASIF